MDMVSRIRERRIKALSLFNYNMDAAYKLHDSMGGHLRDAALSMARAISNIIQKTASTPTERVKLAAEVSKLIAGSIFNGK